MHESSSESVQMYPKIFFILLEKIALYTYKDDWNDKYSRLYRAWCNCSEKLLLTWMTQ